MTDQPILVAVYGSLRKGMGNHRLLDNNDSVHLSTERISGFEMYQYGGSYFPFIRHGDGEITIEVYAVSSMVMRRLDMLEGYDENNKYGGFYNRELVQTSKGQAYIYFIDQDPGRNVRVQHGDWVQFKTAG